MILSLMTSGFNPEKNAITKISIKVDGKEDGFNELICPYEKDYDKAAVNVTGLNRDILFRDGISLKDALAGLQRFIFYKCGAEHSNKPLLMGYRVIDFDIPFLQEAGFDVDEFFKFKILDLYHLIFGLDNIGFFQKKEIVLKNHQLTNVCDQLGIPTQFNGKFDKIMAIEGLYKWLKKEVNDF